MTPQGDRTGLGNAGLPSHLVPGRPKKRPVSAIAEPGLNDRQWEIGSVSSMIP